jgi:LCP family protein required for cell wall assembly
MEETQKNPQNQPQQPDASYNTATVRYDYSHLREPDSRKNHWYAGPNNPQAPPPGTVHMPPPAAIPSPVERKGPTRQRIDDRRKRKASGMPENWAWVVIASALLGLTIVGSLILVVVIRYAVRDNDDGTELAAGPEIEPTSIIYSGEGTEVGGALAGNSLEIQQAKWDGQERFTILLMGLDKRPSETGTAFRTDVMMLISLDPKTNSVGVLSIPRDTYVEVPYAGLQRVNAAYVIGELEGPGGGPRLAMQTVQYNFGIRVNEFVTVDFQTVIGLIDAIGGVDINVQKAIVDYSYPTMDYGTEVVNIPAGQQHFDGETALKYARSRHNSDDIDRARRQQDVLYAARDRILSLGMVDDLLLQAPAIYANLKSGINTGLSFDQMIQLALWFADVPRENIRTGVVSWEYLIGYETPTGGSVLVPNRSRIGSLMVDVFGADYSQ